MASAVIGPLIFLPTFRLKGSFFAIATLAFNEVGLVFANYLESVTGGPRGLQVPFRAGLANMIVMNNDLAKQHGDLAVQLAEQANDATKASDPKTLDTLAHAYNAAGPITLKATVADHDLGKASSTADLVVLPSNHAPADLAVQATADLEGGSSTLSVSFTDAEASDTHTVAITWGDGGTDSVSLGSGATSATP